MIFPPAPAVRFRLAASVLALLTLASPAAAQHRTAPPARTLPAETMARAGLTRTADLFWLLGGWDAFALDGYAVHPSAAGMPGAPLLVVGGQPFSGGPFGQPALPVLPIHLEQVRTAEAMPAPQLVAGRLAPDGAVRLRLGRPAEGAGARAAFSAGNEVGDPGPFRTTEQAVENVDRIGPQLFAEASFGGSRTSARLSLRTLRHYTTDPAIRPRVERYLDLSGGPPLQYLMAPRLALETRGARFGRHRLTAHYTTLRALPFFETLGYELPARRRHTQVGLEGKTPRLTEHAGAVHYRLTYTRAALASDADLLQPTARPGLAFDWAEDRLGGNVALAALPLRLARQPLRLRLGLSADYTRASAAPAASSPDDSSLDDPDLLTTRAYAQLAPGPSSAFPRLTLLLSQTDGQLGGGALLSATVPLAERQRFGAHLAYVRRPYAAGGSFWYWLRQGLRPPLAPDGCISLPASFPASHRLTADFRLRRAFLNDGHAALEVGVRHFHDLTLPRSDFGYDRDGGGLVPRLHLRTGVSGQTFRAAVEGAHAFPEGLTHRLRYDFFTHRATAEGASRAAFEQRFHRTPRHQLRYTAGLAVRDRFSLQGRLTLRAPERWPAYTRAARAAASPYRSRLPAYALLDLTATKRFWRDHLRLRLALRNLLDTPVRTHPAGPVRRLALFISLEASF